MDLSILHVFSYEYRLVLRAHSIRVGPLMTCGPTVCQMMDGQTAEYQFLGRTRLGHSNLERIFVSEGFIDHENSW